MRKGKNSSYFGGSISDGTSNMRIVGFRAGQHIMNEHLMKKLPIRREECQIKRARRGEKMEIQLKDNTALKKSSKIFDMSSLEFDTDAAIAR